MECIAIINQKGGVGKTTTSVNLGVGLAQRGQRVLFIDLDPQGHLTTHLGLDNQARGAGIYEVLTQNLPIESAVHSYSPTAAVVPAQIDLAAAESELVSVVGREVLLRDALMSRDWPYDFAIIDCPPSLGILTLNALSAATRVLIPLQPHFLALQGVGKLFETIALVAQRINRRVQVAGMVICMHESGTRLSGEVIDDLTAFLDSSRDTPAPWSGARVLNTRIRRCVKLAECPSYGQSIFEYAPRSNGAADYLALADELLRILLPATDSAPPPVPMPAQSVTVPAASGSATDDPMPSSGNPASLPDDPGSAGRAAMIDRNLAAASHSGPILGERRTSNAPRSGATPAATSATAARGTKAPAGSAISPVRKASASGTSRGRNTKAEALVVVEQTRTCPKMPSVAPSRHGLAGEPPAVVEPLEPPARPAITTGQETNPG